MKLMTYHLRFGQYLDAKFLLQNAYGEVVMDILLGSKDELRNKEQRGPLKTVCMCTKSSRLTFEKSTFIESIYVEENKGEK